MTEPRSPQIRLKLWSVALHVVAIVAGIWLGVLTFGWLTG